MQESSGHPAPAEGEFASAHGSPQTSSSFNAEIAVDEEIAAAHPGIDSILTIDLARIAENYRRLSEIFRGGTLAAAVKADAYGLGAATVAPVLADAGATTFFVATIEEGVTLRHALAACPHPTYIYVLNGFFAGTEDVYLAHHLTPVLNSLGQIEAWARISQQRQQAFKAAIQFDTGMSRLGLPGNEVDRLVEQTEYLSWFHPTLLMSHLACAEQPNHPLNQEQLRRFRAIIKHLPATEHLPAAQASLANSSGIFLGPSYHFDLARPGIALYGGNPMPDRPNPMAQVVQLKGRILQIREIDADTPVGYGATHRVTGRTKLATVALGYADGFFRSLSNRTSAWIAGQQIPLVGRISMDMVTLDVTAVPERVLHPGLLVDFIGPEDGLETFAKEAGTISYEVISRLGQRLHRHYLPARA